MEYKINGRDYLSDSEISKLRTKIQKIMLSFDAIKLHSIDNKTLQNIIEITNYANEFLSITNIKLKRIELYNFKNIQYGKLTLPSNDGYSNVLGIYGQNGSGKTSVIEALSILKYALMGESLPRTYCDCINKKALFASLNFLFSVKFCDKVYYVEYVLKIGNSNKLINSLNFGMEDLKNQRQIVIFEEILSLYDDNEHKTILINTNNMTKDNPLGLDTDEFLSSKIDETLTNSLLKETSICLYTAKSAIFSEKSINLIESIWPKYQIPILGQKVFPLLWLFKTYGLRALLIVEPKSAPATPENTFHLFADSYIFQIQADKDFSLSPLARKFLEKKIVKINSILPLIIPGLKLGIERLSFKHNPEIFKEDGEAAFNDGLYGLVAIKDGETLPSPFRYESDGVKKIVSILSILTTVYNTNVTAAIDELDAGIFEYLLGEILEIFNEGAKGQLIFTSHNLRALEVLDSDNIYFSTTNPKNRFYQFKGLNFGANLRNCYYREIFMREEDEELYKPTDKLTIELALRKGEENDKQ